MNCYKCNSVLETDRNNCTKCGADIRFYKKIVYASNRYYNDALIKAEARDLSGARDALKISLHLYKKNTDARNLLGLVYYAMGESAEGLKEWVISKNLSPNNNLADRFINTMRRNMRDLDSEGHGIKKYNQALEYAKTGVKDLATIQLKKVVSVHSNMTKAYELLALLYIDDEKYDQARKILNRCLDVDRGNVSALHYLKELDALSGKNQSRSVGVVGEDDREQLIIPVRFRDYGSYLANALYIILGVLLGIAIAWFVIVPGKVQRETGDVVGQARAYEEEISGLQQKIKGLEAASAAAEAEEATEAPTEEEVTEEPETEAPKETITTHPERLTSWVPNQAAVSECVEAWGTGDWVKFVDSFFTINPTMLSGANQAHYRDLVMIASDPAAYGQLLEAADEYANTGHWDQAAAVYDAASRLRPDDATAYLKAAYAYEQLPNPELQANRLWTIAVLFPEIPEAQDAAQKYFELSGETELPPLPEGKTPADYRQNIDAEAIFNEMGAAGPAEEPEDGEAVPETEQAAEAPAPETPAEAPAQPEAIPVEIGTP